MGPRAWWCLVVIRLSSEVFLPLFIRWQICLVGRLVLVKMFDEVDSLHVERNTLSGLFLFKYYRFVTVYPVSYLNYLGLV